MFGVGVSEEEEETKEEAEAAGSLPALGQGTQR